MQHNHCETCGDLLPSQAEFCGFCGSATDRLIDSSARLASLSNDIDAELEEIEAFVPDSSNAVGEDKFSYVLPDVPTERVSFSETVTPATSVRSVSTAPRRTSSPRRAPSPRPAAVQPRRNPQTRTRRRQAPPKGIDGTIIALIFVALVGITGITFAVQYEPPREPRPEHEVLASPTPPAAMEPAPAPTPQPVERVPLHHCRDCKGTGKKLLSGPVDPIRNACKACAGMGYIRGN
jgi:hypothetical protein